MRLQDQIYRQKHTQTDSTPTSVSICLHFVQSWFPSLVFCPRGAMHLHNQTDGQTHTDNQHTYLSICLYLVQRRFPCLVFRPGGALRLHDQTDELTQADRKTHTDRQYTYLSISLHLVQRRFPSLVLSPRGALCLHDQTDGQTHTQTDCTPTSVSVFILYSVGSPPLSSVPGVRFVFTIRQNATHTTVIIRTIPPTATPTIHRLLGESDVGDCVVVAGEM